LKKLSHLQGEGGCGKKLRRAEHWEDVYFWKWGRCSKVKDMGHWEGSGWGGSAGVNGKEALVYPHGTEE